MPRPERRYFNFNSARQPARGTSHIVGAISGIKQIINADYDVQANDTVIVCDSVTPITVYLRCALATWSMIIIKNINIGNVTVIGCGSPPDTIDDEDYQTLSQWSAMQIIDYITGKWIIV